jgi:hypothetical protein
MKKVTKYRIVLFPLGGKTRFLPASTLENAQTIADQCAESNPLIEMNTITETGWVIIK